MKTILLFFIFCFSSYSQHLSKEERQALIDERKQGKNELRSKMESATLPLDKDINKVVYRKVIDVDSTVSESKIYLSLKQWLFNNKKKFSANLKDRNADWAEIFFGIPRANSNSVDQNHKIDAGETLEFPEEYKLISRGTTKFDGSSLGCIRLIYLDFEIKVVAKKGKAKIEIYNLRYAHYNQVTLKPMAIGMSSINGACGYSNEIESLLSCDKCDKEMTRLYYFLNTKFEEIEKDFSKLKFGSGDDEKW